MKITTLLSLVLFTLLGLVSLKGDDKEVLKAVEVEISSENPWTTTLSANVWNRYSIDGTVYADVPVVQGDLWIQHQCGFFFDIWGSSGFEDDNVNFDDEFDLGVGWSGPVGGLDVFIGGWYFWLEDSPVSDVASGKVRVSKTYKVDELGITPFAEYNHYHTFGILTGGNVLRTGVKLSRPISDKLSMYLNPYMMCDDGYFGADSGWRFCAETGIGYQLSPSTSVSVNLKYMSPLDGLNGYNSDTTFGIGVSHTFGK